MNHEETHQTNPNAPRYPLVDIDVDMTHSQMLGKFEYTGGPIFKVVLEC